jgi:predicted NUDIX family NTP pyrophosphohydrolase
MPARSAGLLVHRIDEHGAIEILLVHPGGPFWAKKDDGAWSIPKGEYTDGDDPLATARREFAEELGVEAPTGETIDLGEVRQAGGKVVRVFAVEGDIDASGAVSNTFEMEWPPRSGRRQTFPEVDRAEWFTIEAARTKLLASQVPLLDHLDRRVSRPPPLSHREP